MSDLDRFRAGYQEWATTDAGDDDNVHAYIDALEARVADLEALRAALVRDNRDKTNAVVAVAALARNAYLEGYRQGAQDEGRGDFAGGGEDRWLHSDTFDEARAVLAAEKGKTT